MAAVVPLLQNGRGIYSQGFLVEFSGRNGSSPSLALAYYHWGRWGTERMGAPAREAKDAPNTGRRCAGKSGATAPHRTANASPSPSKAFQVS